MDLSDLKNRLIKLNGERETLNAMIKSNELQLESLNADMEVIEKAQAVVQSVAKQTQEQLSIEIDDIVNLALQTIFPNQYKFHLAYEMARGKTEARFNLTDENDNPVDPMNSTGGGCVDVVCMALRIALYALCTTDNVIIFDEPCRFVSVNLRDRMSELIKVFSDKLKVQIIMVTHIPEFEQNANVIRVKKVGHISEVIA